MSARRREKLRELQRAISGQANLRGIHTVDELLRRNVRLKYKSVALTTTEWRIVLAVLRLEELDT